MCVSNVILRYVRAPERNAVGAAVMPYGPEEETHVGGGHGRNTFSAIDRPQPVRRRFRSRAVSARIVSKSGPFDALNPPPPLYSAASDLESKKR